jgi:hypothetical protein
MPNDKKIKAFYEQDLIPYGIKDYYGDYDTFSNELKEKPETVYHRVKSMNAIENLPDFDKFVNVFGVKKKTSLWKWMVALVQSLINSH